MLLHVDEDLKWQDAVSALDTFRECISNLELEMFHQVGDNYRSVGWLVPITFQ